MVKDRKMSATEKQKLIAMYFKMKAIKEHVEPWSNNSLYVSKFFKIRRSYLVLSMVIEGGEIHHIMLTGLYGRSLCFNFERNTKYFV